MAQRRSARLSLHREAPPPVDPEMELFHRGTEALAAFRRTRAEVEDEREAAAAEDRPRRRRLDPAAAAAAAGGVAFDPPVSPRVGRRSATQDLSAPAPVSAAELELQATLEHMTTTMAEGLAMLAKKVDAQAAAPVMPAIKDPGLKAVAEMAQQNITTDSSQDARAKNAAIIKGCGTLDNMDPPNFDVQKVAMWQEMAAIIQEHPKLSDGVLVERALVVGYNRGHVTVKAGVGMAGYGGAAMPGMGSGMMLPGMAGFGMQPGMGMYGMPPGGLPAGMGGYGVAPSMMAAGMPAGAAAVMPGMGMGMMPGTGMGVAPGVTSGVGAPQWGGGWAPPVMMMAGPQQQGVAGARPPPKFKPGVMCFKCNGMGHYASSCPLGKAAATGANSTAVVPRG